MIAFLRLAAFSFLIVAALPSARGQLIIAHRGASHDAPENTLSSYKLGYKQNADGCELDFHSTKDGKVVIMHDFDTGRVTGGDTNVIGKTTFAKLRKLDIGQWGQWKGSHFHEKIPTLAEAIALVPDGKKFFLEIKCHNDAADEKRTITKTLPAAEKIVKASGKKPEQLPFITFNYASAEAAKKRFPKHDVYWLLSWSKDRKTGEYPDIDEVIKQAKAANLDGLDLNSGFPIDKAFVEKVHGAGLKLYTWTVDDPAVAQAEADAGVDGITTNRPGFLREQLK
jgi:glycerophosphoryl diester phosphodiesterase